VTGKSLINGQRTTFPMPISGDCDNGLDDDADGLIDAADHGCQNGRTVEKSADPTAPPIDGGDQCDNDSDDDGDGFVDSDDPECALFGTEFGESPPTSPPTPTPTATVP
jgi:hypothetical protein